MARVQTHRTSAQAGHLRQSPRRIEVDRNADDDDVGSICAREKGCALRRLVTFKVGVSVEPGRHSNMVPRRARI